MARYEAGEQQGSEAHKLNVYRETKVMNFFTYIFLRIVPNFNSNEIILKLVRFLAAPNITKISNFLPRYSSKQNKIVPLSFDFKI